MKIIKNPLFTFIMGLLISSGIVYAITIYASDISYDNSKSHLKDENNNDVDNVKDAIDVLYSRVHNSNSSSINLCSLDNGPSMTVGSRYRCNLGDNQIRTFYLLTINSNNTVDLIMERNITDYDENKTVSWYDAMNYFTTGTGSSYLSSWPYVVNVKIPSGEAIATAANIDYTKVATGNSWFCVETGLQDSGNANSCYNSTHNNAYLWDYLRGCDNNGCTNNLGDEYAYYYWTSNSQYGRDTHAWDIEYRSIFNTISKNENSIAGVRPVITILKTSLN